MSEDTEMYPKFESHDKRMWIGLSQPLMWRLVWILGFVWIGGGHDAVKHLISGEKQDYATKRDIEEIKQELRNVERALDDHVGRRDEGYGFSTNGWQRRSPYSLTSPHESNEGSR